MNLKLEKVYVGFYCFVVVVWHALYQFWYINQGSWVKNIFWKKLDTKIDLIWRIIEHDDNRIVLIRFIKNVQLLSLLSSKADFQSAIVVN